MESQPDIDRLPFEEYARLTAEEGYKEHGNPNTLKLTFDELVASELTFKEIEAQYGEETAINAGIARDPDAPELDDEWFARARPAIEVMPELVERWRKTRGKQQAPTKELVSIPLDSDIVDHFRSGGSGWQTRLNDMLREATFGPHK
jgi:uncharacterized protein (DUF4415 family)